MIQHIELHDDTPAIFHEIFPRGTDGFHHAGILGHDFPKDRQHMLEQGGADVCYFNGRQNVALIERLSPCDNGKFLKWSGEVHPG